MVDTYWLVAIFWRRGDQVMLGAPIFSIASSSRMPRPYHMFRSSSSTMSLLRASNDSSALRASWSCFHHFGVCCTMVQEFWHCNFLMNRAAWSLKTAGFLLSNFGFHSLFGFSDGSACTWSSLCSLTSLSAMGCYAVEKKKIVRLMDWTNGNLKLCPQCYLTLLLLGPLVYWTHFCTH